MTFIIDTFQSNCKSEHNQVSEIKSHGTCASLTIFFLLYEVVYYLNDFWNLFDDKVYVKNE